MTVDKRVAQILARKLDGLLIVKTQTRNGRPTLTYQHRGRRDRRRLRAGDPTSPAA
jgi:hypothetical protein